MIALPVIRWARWLGVSAMMISTYRRWGVEAGILRPTAAASREKRRASEFVFELSLFDENGRQLVDTKSPRPPV